MYFSSIAEKRNVIAFPKLHKRGMYLLFLDCANGGCVYYSSTAETRNVSTFPRLRK